MARKPYPRRQYPNWAELDPSIDQLLAEGRTVEAIAKDLGLKADTVRAHLRKREVTSTPEHFGIPQEHQDIPEVHQSTLDAPELLEVRSETAEHQGTLEGHQEVMEDISQSVPDVPHIGTEHPSTPEVHQELSLTHSGVLVEHSSVPARHDQLISTPGVHPGTPTADDWELWNTIKARWLEVEKMLADRQALLSTPLGTPGNTQKKTYVFDVRHIALIEGYAQAHRLDLKDVIYAMCEEYFQGRGYPQV